MQDRVDINEETAYDLGEFLLELSNMTRSELPGAPFEWRPGRVFDSEPINTAFGISAAVQARPGFGTVYSWELGNPNGEPTTVAVAPERPWVTLRYTDATEHRKDVDLVPDYLALRGGTSGNTHPVLSVVSVKGRRGSVVNVYATGEVDEHFRHLGPQQSSLPPEALIYNAEVLRARLPASASRPPQTLSRAELPPDPVSELSTAQAAEFLGYTQPSIIELIARGRLPATKIRGRWRLKTADVQAYQRSQAHRRTKPGPQSPAS